MALEDFFTLTEMKDGLTATKRVEELVGVMQKEKCYFVKNVGEASRQWCTVASTIAATKNKECLDLFIELDGLWFFNKWLKESQTFYNATASNSFVDESITALLRALQRLDLDMGKIFSSGIWITVKSLLSCSSASIQENARVLFGSWKLGNDSDEDHHLDNAVAVGASHDDVTALIADSSESANGRNLPAESLDGLLVKEIRDLHGGMLKTQPRHITLEHLDISSLQAVVSSSKQNNVQENVPLMEDLSQDLPKRTTSVDPCTISDTKPGSNEEKLDAQMLDVGTHNDKPTNRIETSPKCPESAPGFLSAGESMKELTSQTSIGANFHEKSSNHGNGGVPVSEINTDQILNCCKKDELDDRGITSSQTEDMNLVDEDEELASDQDEDMAGTSDILKLIMDSSKGFGTNDKSSNIDLEYGLDNALDVAQQVAKAVEREFGESSKGLSCSESITGNDNISSASQSKEISSGKTSGVEASPRTEVSSNKLDTKPDNIESSQLTQAVQEPERNTEKGICEFDLNQEMSSEDMDQPSNPVTDVDNMSTWRGIGSPKQRHDTFDIDLNVSEAGDVPEKLGESPRSVRQKLDLNCADDGSDWRTNGQLSYNPNGNKTHSPASSSSSIQPFFRSIDLNGGPSFFIDSDDHRSTLQLLSSSQYENAYGGLKPVDPVISILGTKVEVNRKDHVPKFKLFQDGKSPEAAIDVDMPRIERFQASNPATVYTNSPAYGFNGHNPSQFMPFYVQGNTIPFMMDSRGAPVVLPPYYQHHHQHPPQHHQHPPQHHHQHPPQHHHQQHHHQQHHHQQQFMNNVTGVPPPLQTNFLNLNSNFTSQLRGNRYEDGSLQLFPPGPVRSTDERSSVRPDLHQPSSSSGIFGKRNESDNGGWESYPFNSRNHQPYWR